MFTVQFQDVGRYKLNWQEGLPELTEVAVIRALKRKKALTSRGIDVVIDGKSGAGGIYAGERPAGRFTFTPLP